jgi:CRP-like cAMP-binding protein
MSQNGSLQHNSPLETLFDESGSGKLKFSAGDALFTADAPAEHLYLVVSGQVRLFQNALDGSARLLEIIGPGQWCGCTSLAQRPTYGYAAIAAGEVTVIRASAADITAKLAGKPETALLLIKQLVSRLYSAWDDAGNLVFDDCRARLIKALIRFSETPAAVKDGENVVLRMTHEQLAQAIGVARETVSLTITDLRKENLVRTGRTQLMFRPIDLSGSLASQMAKQN